LCCCNRPTAVRLHCFHLLSNWNRRRGWRCFRHNIARSKVGGRMRLRRSACARKAALLRGYGR
jgi:hypothetical protein